MAIKAMRADEKIVKRWSSNIRGKLVLVQDEAGRMRLLKLDSMAEGVRSYREVTIRLLERKANGGPIYSHRVSEADADAFAAGQGFEPEGGDG